MHLGSHATLPVVSRILVAIGWAAFTLFFLFKRSPTEHGETKREPRSFLGIALQMAAFMLVWMMQRRLPAAGARLSAVEITLDLLAPLLSIASAWLGFAAVRTLGKQWSLAARLIEDHALVTQGPYQLVRHPIYTAMLGMFLATSFAFGHWLGLVTAGPIFVIGTLVRIRSEEKLLREAFGPEYEAYARRVRAFIPLVV